ncbi:hypothetical protein BDB00DRAFT_840728 [Zychaea mexicana]|uniref:uncharacterized protein n=1 Tax=Zychaea mexicana TaxID=64656 RepID=UPI0022FF1F61|nr:uncharacterized protein BDB00DRAFT_840728 [Zychaea mexicana]KAI9489927.1 hypothetical protein BDB00DRAFT_840728 [Zychaea mexicana]
MPYNSYPSPSYSPSSLFDSPPSTTTASSAPTPDQISEWDKPVELPIHTHQDHADEPPKYQPNPTAPCLVDCSGGKLVYRLYDPDFVPPPLYPESKDLRVEMGYFFDLTQECVAQHINHRKAKEKLATARRLLAHRIAVRLSAVLRRYRDEAARQRVIRRYIHLHIHDTFISTDESLFSLINIYYNKMLGDGLPADMAARDVRI